MTRIPAAARRTRRTLWSGLAALALIVGGFASCGGSPIACTTCGGGGNPPPPPTGTGVLVGAGDVADCDNGVSAGTVATARLLDGLSGTVFAAGDNAYLHGSVDNYNNCYDPYWGRHKGRTWPVPGNHDYETSEAAPYYAYFGGAAGSPGLGYWRRTLGTWTILGLNSERGLPAQIQWLRTELSANRTPCTLAIWHRPLFSSGGPNGDSPDMRDTWQALYDLNVDVIVNGHEHVYERFDPQDANGNPDPARGMRQFTVGTGGATISGFVTVKRNSSVRISYWGVARFTLLDNSYMWEFIPIDGGGGTDSGMGQCH